MCVSCGCKDYDNDYSDDRPITATMLQDAATAATETEGRTFTINEVATNITEYVKTVFGAATP